MKTPNLYCTIQILKLILIWSVQLKYNSIGNFGNFAGFLYDFLPIFVGVYLCKAYYHFYIKYLYLFTFFLFNSIVDSHACIDNEYQLICLNSLANFIKNRNVTIFMSTTVYKYVCVWCVVFYYFEDWLYGFL